jgi:DNA-binding NarL/FixJ family response regulator
MGERRAISPAITGHGLRTLLADDHRGFAQALAGRLGAHPRFDEVCTAYSAERALTLVKSHQFDVLLLDAGLCETSGLGVMREMLKQRPQPAVVVVSGLEDVDQVIDALAGGARAWVPKDAPLDDLLQAVEDALQNQIWLPRGLLGEVLGVLLARPAVSRRTPSFVDNLTPRQVEVLNCLAAGMSRVQIADHLVLSPHTVRTHVQEILRKAGVHSTLAALARARADRHLPGGA